MKRKLRIIAGSLVILLVVVSLSLADIIDTTAPKPKPSQKTPEESVESDIAFVIEIVEQNGPKEPDGDGISIMGRIDKDIAIRVIREIKFLENDSTVTEICIYIDSPGGNAIGAHAICRVMAECQKPIEVRTCRALSAAALIFSSGTKGKRLLFQTGYPKMVMIHQTGFYTEAAREKYEKLSPEKQEFKQARLKYFDKLQCQVLAERTGQPIEKVAEHLDKKTYYSAKQAIKFGFADGYVIFK